jgi:membrane associated rhomboid family serine protease
MLTLFLILITVAVSLIAWRNDSVMQRGLLSPYLINRDRQWYRFISSGFLHADIGHLFFNMFTLYFFGPLVESVMMQLYGAVPGMAAFAAFYLAAMVVADLPTYIKYKAEPGYRAIGASGAVSAVVFASILLDPVRDLCLYGLLCLPGFLFGALYLIYSYWEGRRARGIVNHDAHFYGAVFGLVVMALMLPEAIANFFVQVRSWEGF